MDVGLVDESKLEALGAFLARRVNEKKLEEFLAELKILYVKYQWVINACGCCDSPWIVMVDEVCVDGKRDDTVNGCIEHLRTSCGTLQ